jgi:hypothetical protein
MIPLLSFLAPTRLWLLLLIPLQVVLPLDGAAQANRSAQLGKTIRPGQRGIAPGCGI